MSFEVKFINHACFQIIKKDFSILVDPWFSGKVFNDSWELLRETNIDDLDLSNLKYIFISHKNKRKMQSKNRSLDAQERQY
jgi:L-ascorbate metabolism protein UlaG (beta-lactamase superfamily)